MTEKRLNAAAVVAILVVAAYAAIFSTGIALAVVLWALAATVARRNLAAAVVVGLAMVALVPVYWAPDFPGTIIAASPVIFVCAVLLPAAAEQRAAIRIGVIDRLVLAYTLITALGYLVNSESGVLGNIGASLLTVLFPYGTFRLLGLLEKTSTYAAVGLIIAGVPLSYVAVQEYQGEPNPFFTLVRGGHAQEFFARSDRRLGHPRPEASFGQAIALGMFLVLAIVLAVALAWRKKHGAAPWRPLLYVAAAAMVYALTLNLVRGPIVMLGLAIVLLLVRETRRGHFGRGIVIAVAAAVLVNVGSFANVLQLRDQTFDETSSAGASANYRLEIWRVMTDRSNFSLVGKQIVDEDGLGYSKAAGADVGIKSFDNAFALVYIGFGILGLLAFLALGLRVGKAALLDNLDVIDHAWAAALLAAFINLMTVNLLTQFAHIFWIGIGLVAAAVQRTEDQRESEEAPSADYRLTPWISRPSSA